MKKKNFVNDSVLMQMHSCEGVFEWYEGGSSEWGQNGHLLFSLTLPGLSFESCTDVMGKSDYGHICLFGLGHWTPHWISSAEEALRP